MTHCRPAVVASRSPAMSGSATLITVESSIRTNRPMQVPARVHQRRLAAVRPGRAPIPAAEAAITRSFFAHSVEDDLVDQLAGPGPPRLAGDISVGGVGAALPLDRRARVGGFGCQ